MVNLGDYCKTCSLCCKYPLVLPKERERIIKKARLGLLKQRLFKRRGGYFILERDPCPFLKNGKCSIEEIKPLCCRLFPLVLSPEGGKFSWAISDECPLGDKVPKSYIRKARAIGKKMLDFHNKR